MNKETWNNLAKQDQFAIHRAAEIAYKSLGNVMDESFEVQMQELKKVGAQSRILNNKELCDFEAAAKYQEAQDVWAKEQRAKGIQDVAVVFGKGKDHTQ